MSKKFLFYIFAVVCFIFTNIVNAQEYGRVYLDLADDNEKELKPILNGGALEFVKMAKNYIDDVKDYDDLLEGKSIEKDFSDDFKIKYKDFNDTKVEEWERYVRRGVKTLRYYKDIKQKVIDWVMNQELPIVVDDDQYEMGEKEEYIESDKPLVIQDFKKVVAYSGREKDVLAAKEKNAEKNNSTKPSEFIIKTKKALMEGNWRELFSSYIADIKESIYKLPKSVNDGKTNRARASILPRYQYSDKDGKIEGVILIELAQKTVLLYNSYNDYKKLDVNFDNSVNIKDWKTGFLRPQMIETKKAKNLLVYATRIPIYFEAKIEDVTKNVEIRPVINANVCFEDSCEAVLLNPVVELDAKEKDDYDETMYSSYITSIKMNVPDDKYKKKYEIGDLVWEDKGDGSLGNLRVDIKTSENSAVDVFIVSDEIKYFSAPRYSLEENRVTARFDLTDPNFKPLNKEISFWISTKNRMNYIYTQKVKEVSLFDIHSGKMSFAILSIAFLGGILLNFMPCVFPVLFLKLLAYTKLKTLDLRQIRYNFILNIAGILTSFAVMALILAGLKFFGQAVGWGMQFQNIYFLVTILWAVIFFVYYVSGLLDFRAPDVSKKIEKISKGKAVEFLSGVFLVMLSTPCMAPYLGTAFGIALAGDILAIISTVMVVGSGLALPYIIVAIYPKLAFYFPKPAKWMKLINFCMILLLIITIIWLISILSAQTNLAQVWHWILYIFVMFCILYFWKAIKTEIDKIKDKPKALQVYKKIGIVFCLILIAFIGLSFVDASYALKNRKEYISENYVSKLDLDNIKGMVNNGNQILVKVGADWCLTCKYNDFTTFDIDFLKNEFENNNVFVINIDWTKYQPQVLQFMQKFGRSGLPFYVLFSDRYPEGVVLPEIVDAYEIWKLIER